MISVKADLMILKNGVTMARAPKITLERISVLIQSGCGTGFGEDYNPILQIKRWNPSPVSVQVTKALPPFRRRCHFFSHSEWLLALLFSWLGALVREQFPMWPWRHPHPDYSLDPEIDKYLPWSAGMMEICREYGVKHGVFVGTDIQYIWSMDLCINMPWISDPTKRSCFVSIKPLESEKYIYIDPLDRGPEKLEGERRYAKALGIPYFVGDRSLFPGDLFAQLEYLVEAANLPTSHQLYNILHRFLNAESGDINNQPISEISARLQQDYHLTSHQAVFLQNHIMWHQLVDCDLSLPIKTSLPPIPGGHKLKVALRKSLEHGEAK